MKVVSGGKWIMLAVLMGAASTSVGQAGSAPAPVSPLQASADSLFQASDFAKAVPAYEAFLKKDTSVAISWNRYGWSLQKTGKPDQALSAYAHVLNKKTTPGVMITAYYRIALIRAGRNEADKFMSALDSMIQYGYSDIGGIDTLSEFAAMRSDARFAARRTKIEANAMPCKFDPNFRKFDFWIGEWVVHQITPTGPISGWSKIEQMAGGCGILENWTSNPSRGILGGPYEGKSINFYDSASGGWEQYWVGSGSTGTPMTRFYNGHYDENQKAMVFQFDPVGPKGEKQLGRFRFFNQGPDQVRQFSESSADNGATWTTNYDFIYVRKK